MLTNVKDISHFEQEIRNVFLAEKLNQALFKTPFYLHLDEMLKYYIFYSKNIKEISLTEAVYNELGIYILENYDSENGNLPIIDWDFIEKMTELLQDKIKKQLGTEKNSSFLKPFIDSTIDSFEKQLIFYYSHKNQEINPWNAAFQILQNGCLYLISGNRDVFKEFYPKMLQNDSKNVGIIAVNKRKPQKSNENKFAGFVVDNRHNLQTVVYNLLQEFAKGHQNAVKAEKIKQLLAEKNREINLQTLKNNILLVLKRQGLIGSKTSGFYFIENEEDLRETHFFHSQKLNRIKTTLNFLEKKATIMGFSIT